MADTDENRALAEAAVSKILGYRISDLRSGAPLPDLALRTPKFKRSAGVTPKELGPAVAIAERAAGLTVPFLRGVPEFILPESAKVVREETLSKARTVDLGSLLDYCWSHGIVVLPVTRFPRGAKKFDAMALFVGSRPVIALASRKTGPPWLAFPLAHDLGHIVHQHVTENSRPLTDTNLESAADDDEEKEANDFALELLGGERELGLPPRVGTTAERLARMALDAQRQTGVDPGFYVLAFGYKIGDRWPVANKALGELGLNHGGEEMVARCLRGHLDWDAMPEGVARFLGSEFSISTATI